MKRWVVAMAVLGLVQMATAQDIGFFGSMTQDDFSAFSTELGTAVWFQPGAPAETLGVTGFDLSADLSLVNISDGAAYWRNMTDGSPDSSLAVTRVHAMKGLPGGWDVGMMWADLGDTNGSAWGVEARYALVEGSFAFPAVTARVTYSKLSGVDDLDLNTASLGLMISKGFLMLTPYAGASLVRVDASPRLAETGLTGVTETMTVVYGGVQFSPFPFLVINGEVSRGEVTTTALKVGIRF